MLEGLVLGIIQGVTEWLPISSEGVLTLVGLKFFGRDLMSSVSLAVFLHLGTFLAALVFFWKDVARVFRKDGRKLFYFLFVATIVTGVIGFIIFNFGIKTFAGISATMLVGLIGFFLILTGLVQLKKQDELFRSEKDLKVQDGLILGVAQGLAVLPGFSRSGLTIAGLLFRKFRDTDALRLSFLMSLPAVLGGNIFLNISGFGVKLDTTSIIAVLVSFLVGFLTIRILLQISRKINFGWFALGFGVLTLISLLFI